ncbi:MAG TPA: two-component sensor histidine kinase, partial [Erythrobacter sp.]|nr:two-component sensor histidine kinase [Erythrobacter sp.]
MSEPSFPWSGFVLAFVACIILATLGVDLIYVGLVLLVWVGSLYLVAARPPEAKAAPAGPAFTRDNMADLFEHSETPVVITERDRVIIANLSARTLLGSHIVGQDVRMALRQPEA